MNRALGLTALAACLLGLSGCNMLVSEEPWFAAAEGQPWPVERDGLWLNAAPDCEFDETMPVERWPECARASFVRGDQHWSMQWKDTDERGRRRRTFDGWELIEFDDTMLLVANGDHLIVQARSQEQDGASPTDQVDHGDEQAAPPAYMYSGLRLLGHDEAGKVTAMELWTVQCGPLPEKRPSRGRGREPDEDAQALTEGSVTDRPFPGLTVIDDNCVAESVEAVRNAAVLSEALEPPTRSQWVREGWH